MRTSWTLVIAAALAIGCSKPPASPAPAPAAAPAAGSAEAKQVVCTLDCSGTETQGYGATEEEARADATSHVSEKCKPEDGQYFITCDPAH